MDKNRTQMNIDSTDYVKKYLEICVYTCAARSAGVCKICVPFLYNPGQLRNI